MGIKQIKDLVPLNIETPTIMEMFNSPQLEVRRINKNDIALLGGTAWMTAPYSVETYEEMKELNEDMEHRVEFFFTPNGRCGVNGNKKRGKAYCTFFDYLCFDTDHWDTKKTTQAVIEYLQDIMQDSELEPNLIVQTGKGYHIYYKLEKPIPYSDKGSADYKYILEQINENLNPEMGLSKKEKTVDTACSDCARLLRVPNSSYWKNFSGDSIDPIKMNVLHYSRAGALDFHWLVKWLQVQAEKNKPTAQFKPWRTKKMTNDEMVRKTGQDRVDARINELPIKEVLESCWYEVRGNVIYQNGKPTSWWKIQPKGNKTVDFSHNKERPGGNCIQTLSLHFKWDLSKVYQHADDVLNIDCSEVLNYKWQAVSVDFQMWIDENWEAIKTDVLYAETLWTIKNNYIRKKISFIPIKWVEEDVCNFCIDVIWRVEVAGKMKILIQLKSDHFESRAIQLPPEWTAAGINKIIKQEWMFDISRSWGKFISLLTLLLVEKVKDREDISLVRSIKYLEDGSFCGGDCIQTVKWKILIPDPKTKMIGKNIVNFSHSASEKSVTDIQATDSKKWFDLLLWENHSMNWSKFLKLLTEELPAIYEPTNIIPLFLALMNSVFSDFYYTNKIKMPHIIVWWETRAGKTEIITFCKRLLAFKDVDWIWVTSMTMFPFLVAGSSWVTVHLTEWTNSAKMSKDIQVQAKDSFDFRDIKRGTANQEVVEYEMKWNIMFDWEEVPSEDALQTRSIVCFFKKKHKKKIPRFNTHLANVIKEYTWTINYLISRARKVFSDKDKYLDFLSTSEEELIKYIEKRKLLTEGDDTDRIAQNYAQLLCMYKICTDSKEKNGFILKVIAEAMVSAIKSNKNFSSADKHLENFFTPILWIVMRWRKSAAWLIRVKTSQKTIYITDMMMKASIKGQAEKDAYRQAVVFLSQNGYLNDKSWMIEIDLKNPALRSYIHNLETLLYLCYENDIFQTPIDVNTQTAVDEILKLN